MEDLLHAFGIDIKLIVIQILNFAVLAVALTYFLYKPILTMLQDREKTIKKGVEDAEFAKNAKDDAVNARNEVLKTAHKEAEAVEERATLHAQEKADALIVSAQEKADALIAEAHQKSEELKIQAKVESEAEIAKLALLSAEKVLKEQSS